MKFNQKVLQSYTEKVIALIGVGNEPTDFGRLSSNLSELNLSCIEAFKDASDLSIIKTIEPYRSSYGANMFFTDDFKTAYCIAGYGHTFPTLVVKKYLEPLSNGLLNTPKVGDFDTQLVYVDNVNRHTIEGPNGFIKEYLASNGPSVFTGMLVVQTLKLTERFAKLKESISTEIEVYKKELNDILNLAVSIDKKVFSNKDVLTVIKKINDIDKRIVTLKADLVEAEDAKRELIVATKFNTLKGVSDETRLSIEGFSNPYGLRRLALHSYASEMAGKTLSFELKDYVALFEKYFSIVLQRKYVVPPSGSGYVAGTDPISFTIRRPWYNSPTANRGRSSLAEAAYRAQQQQQAQNDVNERIREHIRTLTSSTISTSTSVSDVEISSLRESIPEPPIRTATVDYTDYSDRFRLMNDEEHL